MRVNTRCINSARETSSIYLEVVLKVDGQVDVGAGLAHQLHHPEVLQPQGVLQDVLQLRRLPREQPTVIYRISTHC